MYSQTCKVPTKILVPILLFPVKKSKTEGICLLKGLMIGHIPKQNINMFRLWCMWNLNIDSRM